MSKQASLIVVVSFAVRLETGSKAELSKLRKSAKKLLASKSAKALGKGIEFDSRLGSGGFFIDTPFIQANRKGR